MPNGNIGGKLYRAEYVDLTLEQLKRDFAGLNLSEASLKRHLDQMRKEVLYRNEQYQVAIDKHPAHGFNGATIWHLSIKRIDKEPIMDWRDLQEIKNQLCGAEAEAIQLFPAESRVVDTANQYHLFAWMKLNGKRLPQWPVGWTTRFVSNTQLVTGKQRMREEADNTNSRIK